jgi:hypothetical protein
MTLVSDFAALPRPLKIPDLLKYFVVKNDLGPGFETLNDLKRMDLLKYRQLEK